MESLANPSATPQKRPAYLIAAAILGAIFFGVYGWVYYFEPFTPQSDYFNDKIGDTLVFLPAMAAAILASILARQFKPNEPPYRIWFSFSIGWWCWTGGELLGYIYDHFYWYETYPEFTGIDACWVLGYIFFGLSLYYQIRLIYWKNNHGSINYLAYIAGTALLALGLTKWAVAAGLGEGFSLPAVYLSVLYPVFDVFEGGVALWLFFVFGRGYLGRPWWGLIAFAIADSINIYSWMGGLDNVAENIYYAFDLFSALAYIAGYIITALAFLSAIVHIRSSLPAQHEGPASKD